MKKNFTETTSIMPVASESNDFNYTVSNYLDGAKTLNVEISGTISANMEFQDPVLEQGDEEGLFFIRPLMGGTIIIVWVDDVINTFIDLQEQLHIQMRDGSYISLGH